jgi:hypothetical protein
MVNPFVRTKARMLDDIKNHRPRRAMPITAAPWSLDE